MILKDAGVLWPLSDHYVCPQYHWKPFCKSTGSCISSIFIFKSKDCQQNIFKNYKGLARQVFESINIVNSKNEDQYPLNDKNEFNQALIVTAKYTKGIY